MKDSSGISFVMKCILLFLIMGTAQSRSIELGAQSKGITLRMENKTVQEILSEIESKSGVYFTYNPEQINVERKTSVSAENQSVEEVLNRLFAGENVKYSVSNRHIVLYREAQGASTDSRQQSGDIRITGKVTDNFNSDITGATITVRGYPALGTTTDANGEFAIAVPSDTCVLRIFFVGYRTEEVTVGKSRILSIVLKESESMLDEITVVAFGKQKKASVIGSISTINVKDLRVPSSNLTTSLAGKIAGIVSYQRSGEPGQDDASFFVRGVTSLTYASGPLILIDGMEMSSSDLARLQPDDIASFSIMKDATATALYGARGANGVILVTTKEGREGKAVFSARVESSLSAPTQNIKLADPVTYMKLNNEAVLTRNKMISVPYSMEKIENTENPDRNKYVYPANDWYDMLFNDYVFNYRANFNVSGGGKIARYYIAATYNQDNGVLKVDKRNNYNNNIDLKRYLLRTNVNINVTKTTEAVVRLHGTFDDYQGPIDGGSTLYQKAMRSDPVLFPAVYAPDLTYAYVQHPLFGNTDRGQYINPYADMVKGYKDYSKSMFLAQFEVKQNLNFITEGLQLRGLFNTNRYAYFEVQRSTSPYYYTLGYYDKYTDAYSLSCLNPEGGREWLDYTENEKKINTTIYGEIAANYDRTFADRHAVSGMLVSTIRNYLETDASDVQLSLPHRNLGLSGRFTYAYDNRYFTEFNFGYNGSERFARRERFGFFPSMGLGWILSNEKFWNEKIKSAVSKMKLKATYGLVGNDAIGDAKARFFYMSNVNMNDGGRGYTFGNEFSYSRNGISISRYANDRITWETSKKLNLGVELGLFDKVEIIADYYTEHREGILLTRSDIPTTSGLQNSIPQANLGKAFGNGIDLSVDYMHNITNQLWVTGRANLTYAKTKYTEYEEVDNSLTPWLSRIGQPVSQRWGYVAERLFVDDYEVNNSPRQEFGEYAGGDIKYRDINRDGKINSLDKVPVGFPTEPQIIYGFGLSAGYKTWDLSFFFQGLAQESFWINTQASGDRPSTVPFIDTDMNGNISSKNALLQAYAENHWSENNKNIYALWPRFSEKMIDNNFSDWNTWFMRDGSFLRLKSVEFGYAVPKKMLSQFGVDNLRFYFSGTNMLTFSKFKLWDPEMAGSGLGYPVQKVYNIGLQLSF